MRILDPANVMSLIRVPLACAVWLNPGDPLFLLTVVALAAVSDGLDGWLGRKEHANLQGTANVGAWLDPVCDKIFLASAAIAVAVTYAPPVSVIVLVLFRDVVIGVLAIAFRVMGGAALFHAHDFRATATGKVTTVAQTATVIAVVVAPDYAPALAVATALVGAVAVFDRITRVLKQRSEARV